MQKYIQQSIVAGFLFFNSTLSFGAMPPSAVPSEAIPFTIPSSAMQDGNVNKDFFKNLKESAISSVEKYGQFNDHDMRNVFKNSAEDEKLEETFFYMYSSSMPMVTLQNLLPQMKKLKEVNPKASLYIVLNGFPEPSFWTKLRTLYKDENQNLFKVKIHPRIYEAYKLEQVPAWVRTECPQNFKFKNCKTSESYLAKGDISLLDFYELLVKKDNLFMPTYQKLIEAK